MHAYWFYLILINALGLLLMHWDKKKARLRQWRIPEAVLFGTALLGGSFGALAGMYAFHHKTRHPLFSIGLPMAAILHGCLLSVYLFA